MHNNYFNNILTVCFLAIGMGVGSNKAAAQNLAAGDILFTGFDSTIPAGNPDKFSFAALTAIPAGTVIYFTERGYFNTTGWQAAGGSEGTIKWVTGNALNVGDEVLIAGFAATVGGVANGTVTLFSGGNPNSGLSLSSIGDQIIAFQSTTGDAATAGNTNIAGIHWAYCPNGNMAAYTTDATWDPINTVGSCNAGPSSSSLPPGLSPTVSSFWIGFALDPSIQNYQQASFNGTGSPFADAAAIRTAVLNKNNWTKTISNVSGTVPVPSGNIVMQPALGLGNVDAFAVSIYPNPAHSEVTVVVPEVSGSSSLTVTDLRGRVVKHQSLFSGSNRITIGELKAATYLFEITSGDGRKVVKKVVKK